MPLLYGEGANAFIRLQEEILKISNDQSIFSWKYPIVEFYRDESEDFMLQGLLGSTPELFRRSDAISQFYSETAGRAFPVSTNKGVQVQFLMCQDIGYPSGLVYLAMLTCPVGHVPGPLPAIHLKRLSPSSEQYTRIDMSQLFIFSSYDSAGPIELAGFDPRKPQRQLVEIRSRTLYSYWTVQTLFIKQDTQFALPPGFWLAIPEPFSEFVMVVIQAHSRDLWDSTTMFLQPQVDFRQRARDSGSQKIRCISHQMGEF